MSDTLKLRMTHDDLDAAAKLLASRAKAPRIPKALLAKLVCDYGRVFDFAKENRVEVVERADS